jgi:lipopolysaccharide export system protein LptA
MHRRGKISHKKQAFSKVMRGKNDTFAGLGNRVFFSQKIKYGRNISASGNKR